MEKEMTTARGGEDQDADYWTINTTTTATATIDDGDSSFWSDDQLRLLLTIPRSVHIGLGVALILIVVFGVATNGTILYVFTR